MLIPEAKIHLNPFNPSVRSLWDRMDINGWKFFCDWREADDENNVHDAYQLPGSFLFQCRLARVCLHSGHSKSIYMYLHSVPTCIANFDYTLLQNFSIYNSYNQAQATLLNLYISLMTGSFSLSWSTTMWKRWCMWKRPGEFKGEEW